MLRSAKLGARERESWDSERDREAGRRSSPSCEGLRPSITGYSLESYVHPVTLRELALRVRDRKLTSPFAMKDFARLHQATLHDA